MQNHLKSAKSLGPTQERKPRNILQDSSSFQSFQIELHEYGLDHAQQEVPDFQEEAKHQDDRVRVVYEPVEYGSANFSERYRGE